MRHYDIPYVKNGPANYYPPVNIQDLSLEELKAKYLKTCGKCNGDPSVCSKCSTPCDYGKRAVQIIANQVYNDPPIPLYGGKTMIQKAQEQNMQRREALRRKEEEEKKANENKPEELVVKKRKDGTVIIENWYEKAIASDDPIAWIMNAYNCSKTKAKQKIYVWRNTHPETKAETEAILASLRKANKENSEAATEKETEVPAKEESNEQEHKTDSNIESTLEKLMHRQEEYKKSMDKYLKLYEQAKEEYEKIKHKTDILCCAIDIISE